MYKRLTVVALVLVLAITYTIGCAKPAKKPAPKIPDKISRGAGKEPVLSVYEVQTHSVKEMKLEDYVTGVVAGEMENHWPVEALAVQAILARTYVLEFIEDKGGSKYSGADISTDFEEAQAWNPKNINDRIKKAVKMTRGEVITYKGEYIKAWFHSHAGGITSTAKEGLNFKEAEPPYIKVTKSPDTDAGPAGKKTWSASFSKDEISSVIRDKLGVETGLSTVSVWQSGDLPAGLHILKSEMRRYQLRNSALLLGVWI